jgi:hypothetical protein
MENGDKRTIVGAIIHYALVPIYQYQSLLEHESHPPAFVYREQGVMNYSPYKFSYSTVRMYKGANRADLAYPL